jgi:hypothetical protein
MSVYKPVETIGKFKRTEEVAGTCLQGYIEATRDDLEAVFGAAGQGDDYKFFFHWGIEIQTPNGTKHIATIYDWKYDRIAPATEKIQWNIGGSSREAVRLISDILCEELQVTNFYTKAQRA